MIVKKFVVMSLSCMAVLVMVTAASAGLMEPPSLGTFADENRDQWTIAYFEGTSGQVSIKDYQDAVIAGFKAGIQGTAAGKSWIGDDIWVQWSEKLTGIHGDVVWISPGNKEGDVAAPIAGGLNFLPGFYAYTIELGTFTDLNVLRLAGGVVTDDVLFSAVVWSDTGYWESVPFPYLFGDHPINEIEGYANFEDLRAGTYSLTLFIENFNSNGDNPQGMASWLTLTVGTAEGKNYPSPEPATLLVLGLGAAGAGFAARRRQGK